MAEPSLSANGDGTVGLEWPDGRPEKVLISSTLLEEWVVARNALVKRTKALEGLLASIRIGHQPSNADWREANLPPIPPEVRIDLLRRRIPRPGQPRD